MTALTVGEGVPPRGWGALIDRLTQAGLLAPAGEESDRRLSPEIQDAMVLDLEQLPAGLSAVRAELIEAGLAGGPPGVAGQLALWSRELSDWDALEQVWLRFPARELYASGLAGRALADLPERVRAGWPALGYAAAVIAGDGVGGDDLDAKVRRYISDGWTLHGQWRQQRKADAAIAAGTMRLFAETSIAATRDDPGLDVAAATVRDIENLILEHLRGDQPPAPPLLAFFHSAAASMAIMRRDLAEAKRHALLGMHWSPECDLSGFMSALELSIASLASGSPKEHRRAMRYIEEHADHRCPAAEWVHPLTYLPRALADVRLLRRRKAADPSPASTSSTALRRLGYAPIQLWVSSFVGILWSEPEMALAEFDAGVASVDQASTMGAGWWPLVLRARVELLLSLGAVNRARRALADLRAQDPLLALVPAARLHLFSREFDAAAAVADEGLYSLQVPLHERAHLEVVKAASRMLTDADPRTVDLLVNAACLVCQEASSLLPFAMLPPDLRGQLLQHHASDHVEGGCLLGEADRSGTFDTLVPKQWWGNYPVHLTPREQVLLPLLAQTLSMAEIARLEFVSINTLRKQEAELRRKLNAHSRSELVAKAYQFGLLAASDGQPEA